MEIAHDVIRELGVIDYEELATLGLKGGLNVIETEPGQALAVLDHDDCGSGIL